MLTSHIPIYAQTSPHPTFQALLPSEGFRMQHRRLALLGSVLQCRQTRGRGSRTHPTLVRVHKKYYCLRHSLSILHTRVYVQHTDTPTRLHLHPLNRALVSTVRLPDGERKEVAPPRMAIDQRKQLCGRLLVPQRLLPCLRCKQHGADDARRTIASHGVLACRGVQER